MSAYVSIVNDPIVQNDATVERQILTDLFRSRYIRSYDDLRPLKQCVTTLDELTLLRASDLLAAGVFPRHVRILEGVLAREGKAFLPEHASRIAALRACYGSVGAIPLRMVFFASPLPAKLARLRIVSLGALLSLSSLTVQKLPVIDRFDLFELQMVLTEYRPELLSALRTAA